MRHAVRPALLGAALVAVGLLVTVLPGGAAGVLDRVRGEGAAVFLLVATALCAVGVPRQVVVYAGAFAFGFWQGGALALLAQLLACAIDLWWARQLGGDWARRRMARYPGGRVARLDALLSTQPFTTTLTLRLLPVGNNLLLNLLAGVSGIATGPFLLASALGYVPQTVIFALLGAGTRVEQPVQIVIAAALFVISALGGMLLLRRARAAAA